MTLDPHGFLPLFAQETAAQLTALEAALHALEERPDDAEALRSAFQAAHSIKGGAAMLDLHALHGLMGAFEDLLQHLRDRPGRLDPGRWLPDAFTARDLILAQLSDLRPGEPPPPEAEQLILNLRGHHPTPDAHPTPETPVAPPVQAAPAAAVMDVSALAADSTGTHLRALGFEVQVTTGVVPFAGQRLGVVSARLAGAALEAGWPAGRLSVLSESAETRAAWAARGLHVTARPARAARATLPDAWKDAALPGRPDS
ncbi:Hpt domain-containing protein [Deinococcus depolymerans]|uniref:HPt domain-containing protein n=1 Tax=Deinococcus depolymerans TaxID=392408 RepID=A0ABP3M7Q9_9DEIO